ncbi:MAG: HEAT repeat domain-containing protein [Gemmatimonadaceae bacterium]|nr:HEAT repeat domain-containing protein [Gemmatimonadaceae bacterium]
MSHSLYSRTPTTKTPDSGVARIAAEGRASRAVAKALATLVERLIQMGPDSAGVVGGLADVDPASPQLVLVKEALRQVAARSREGAMLCRLVGDTLVLEGVPLDRQAEVNDPELEGLHRRLATLAIGAVTVREGAAPGELLTLARLLAQPLVPEPVRAMGTPSRGLAAADTDTPRSIGVVGHTDEGPRELLRTWSVLVTPAVHEAREVRPTSPDEVAAGASVSLVLSRLAAVRSDEGALGASAGISALLDDAQRRGDGAVVESIARALLIQVNTVGDQGGRLALEGTLRTLLGAPLLNLLAARLPLTIDRVPLLQLFSRAGDAGVKTLVQQLLSTDDAQSRRTYFDSIVALDVGARELYEALQDSRWYVVRNAAALLGEMGVEHADEALIPLLQHSDERIRIAVGRALMRLRTPKALQALHGMIEDSHAELRRLAAAAFGLTGAVVGHGIRPPAARLAVALEKESDEDVALEMLAALGRLGSADAVQRLLRIALPATADMTGLKAPEPRNPYLRIAALEALVRSRGAQMQPVIDALKADADREVALAAASIR